MNYNFTVPGEPQAQGRPRFYRRGRFVGVYDPKESKDYKERVAACARAAGVKMMTGPIAMEITAYMKRPLRIMPNDRPRPRRPVYVAPGRG